MKSKLIKIQHKDYPENGLYWWPQELYDGPWIRKGILDTYGVQAIDINPILYKACIHILIDLTSVL